MKIKNNKVSELICTDYDDTIAVKGIVNRRTVNEIKNFVSSGGQFTIATGRMYRSIKEDAIVNFCNLPLICANGAIICEAKTGEIIFEKNIDVKMLAFLISRFEGLLKNIHIVCTNRSYDVTAAELGQFNFEEKIYRVDLKCKTNIEIPKLMDTVRTCTDLSASYRHHDLVIELSASNKGEALKWICETFGVCGRVVAIGDSENDISMCSVANMLYAVKNAAPTLKNKADIVLHCTCEHNPVAEVLARENGYYGSLHPILYLKTVSHHRREVYRLCKSVGISIRGIMHDLSKFSLVEFICGMRYYSGTSSPISLERKLFGKSKAWNHHVSHNKHHSEYWIIRSKDGDKTSFAEMPTVYWIEQVCDRIAASKVYLGSNYNSSAPYERFVHEKAAQRMGASTAQSIENALLILSEKGENSLIEYLRNILKEEKE